jgi:hypothetical protein
MINFPQISQIDAQIAQIFFYVNCVLRRNSSAYSARQSAKSAGNNQI